MRNKGCRNPEDLEAILALPVLATVPAMSSARERLQGQRRRRILTFALAVALIVCLALAAWAVL